MPKLCMHVVFLRCSGAWPVHVYSKKDSNADQRATGCRAQSKATQVDSALHFSLPCSRPVCAVFCDLLQSWRSCLPFKITEFSRAQGTSPAARVGQIHIYGPYMIIYSVTSLPKIPYSHRTYMVLANPISSPKGTPVQSKASQVGRALHFNLPWGLSVQFCLPFGLQPRWRALPQGRTARQGACTPAKK